MTCSTSMPLCNAANATTKLLGQQHGQEVSCIQAHHCPDKHTNNQQECVLPSRRTPRVSISAAAKNSQVWWSSRPSANTSSRWQVLSSCMRIGTMGHR